MKKKRLEREHLQQHTHTHTLEQKSVESSVDASKAMMLDDEAKQTLCGVKREREMEGEKEGESDVSGQERTDEQCIKAVKVEG